MHDEVRQNGQGGFRRGRVRGPRIGELTSRGNDPQGRIPSYVAIREQGVETDS
jgi:hypothetical protein